MEGINAERDYAFGVEIPPLLCELPSLLSLRRVSVVRSAALIFSVGMFSPWARLCGGELRQGSSI